MFGFSYVIYLTFFVANLTKEMGLPPVSAGRIFAVLGIFSIFCGVIYGCGSDVLGRRWGFMLAYLTLAISYLIFAFWKDTKGFYVSAVVFGIAAFSVPTIMAAASGDTVGGVGHRLALGSLPSFSGLARHLGRPWGDGLRIPRGHLPMHLCYRQPYPCWGRQVP